MICVQIYVNSKSMHSRCALGASMSPTAAPIHTSDWRAAVQALSSSPPKPPFPDPLIQVSVAAADNGCSVLVIEWAESSSPPWLQTPWKIAKTALLSPSLSVRLEVICIIVSRCTLIMVKQA